MDECCFWNEIGFYRGKLVVKFVKKLFEEKVCPNVCYNSSPLFLNVFKKTTSYEVDRQTMIVCVKNYAYLYIFFFAQLKYVLTHKTISKQTIHAIVTVLRIYLICFTFVK